MVIERVLKPKQYIVQFNSVFPSVIFVFLHPHLKAGAYLKTHDFLQPLEGLGKNITKEENSTVEIITTLDKPPPPAPSPTTTSGEHLLPGGIGTYSISHISNYFNQTVLKPEGAAAVFTVAQSSSTDRNEENSNSSSFNTGSGFTLWEESAVKKGKTGKENVASGDSKQVSKGKAQSSCLLPHYDLHFITCPFMHFVGIVFFSCILVLWFWNQKKGVNSQIVIVFIFVGIIFFSEI